MTSYEIKKTDGTILTTVQDGTVDDTSSSIAFFGKRYADYGKVFNENALHMLENFSNSTPPSSPIIGQLWYDKTPGITALKVYSGTGGWKALNFTETFQTKTVDDPVIFNDQATFTGATIFNDPVTFNDNIGVFGDISFNTTTFTGDIIVSATTTFTGTLNLDGSTNYNSTVNFNNNATFDKEVTFNKDIHLQNARIEVVGARIVSDTMIYTSDVFNTDIGVFIDEQIQGTTYTATGSGFVEMAFYSRKFEGTNSNTILLLDFAGSEGATSTTDLSPGTTSNGGTGPDNTIAFSGTAAIDTYRGIRGGGSLLLDGNSDYITITDNTNYDFSTNPFVMDGWIYTDSASTEQVIIAKGTASATDRWEVYINATNNLAFAFNDGTNSIAINGGLISTYKWTHWALERETSGSNAIFTLYVDGNRAAQTTVTSATYDMDVITSNVVIGRRGYGTFEYFSGNMDDIRIHKGEAKYNGAFRPRTIPIDPQGSPVFTNYANNTYRVEFVDDTW